MNNKTQLFIKRHKGPFKLYLYAGHSNVNITTIILYIIYLYLVISNCNLIQIKLPLQHHSQFKPYTYGHYLMKHIFASINDPMLDIT